MLARANRHVGWLILFIVLLAPSGEAGEFIGLVVSVLDGDTIEVLHNNHAERI